MASFESETAGTTPPATETLESLSPTQRNIDLDPPEPKLNRKREREVSIEPGTPKDEPDVLEESRDRRAPAKKNRLQPIDGEDEDRSRSPRSKPSPPLCSSPPEASKLHQIRQRVEDMTVEKSQTDEAMRDVPAPTTPKNAHARLMEDEHMQTAGRTPASVSMATMIATPGSPMKVDPGSTKRTPLIGSSKSIGQVAPMDFEDDPDKSLKRKALTRAASSSQLTTAPAPKRPREDGTTSPNLSQSPASTKPKSSMGFLAFSAAASPFAHVKSDSSPFGSGPSPSRLFSNASPSKSPPPATGFAANIKSSSWSNVFSGSGASNTSGGTSTVFGGSSTVTSAPLNPQPVRAFNSFGGFSSTPTFGSTSAPSPTSSAAAALSRKKSPRPIQAFGSYSSSAARFGAPSVSKQRSNASVAPSQGEKRRKKTHDEGDGSGEKTSEGSGPEHEGEGSAEREGSPSPQQASFGDILRGSGDAPPESDQEDDKPTKLVETEVLTGEENESTIFQTRAKLHTMGSDAQWRERGTGTLKVNVQRTDRGKARLVMRAEGVYRVILNVTLFEGMHCMLGPDPKYVKLAAIEEGKIVNHAIKTGSIKLAQELLDHIRENIPIRPGTTEDFAVESPDSAHASPPTDSPAFKAAQISPAIAAPPSTTETSIVMPVVSSAHLEP